MTRELRLSIGAVLQKHNINDLALEMELATTVQHFYDERKIGRDAGEVKLEIQQAFLSGQEAHREKEYIFSYIKDKLNINPTGPELETRWGRLYEYAYTQEKEHKEKIEVFIAWWLSHNPDPTYWSPERMITMWPQAFKGKKKLVEEKDKWEGNWVKHL